MAAAATAAVEDTTNRCLKYGDIVFFQLDGKPAFVSAHDKMVPQVRAEELQESVDAPVDLQDCLFQVTQKYAYTQKDVFHQELARNNLPDNYLTEAEDDGGGATLFSDVKSRSARIRLTTLYHAYRREGQVNHEEFMQTVGEPLLYGQVVQLRHVASNKFLCIKRTAADVERGTLKVVLEEGGAAGSWFIITSGYRTKPDGSKLMPCDMVALRSKSIADNGLHISAAMVTDPKMLPVYDEHPYIASTYEVSASPETNTLRMVPFRTHPRTSPGLAETLTGYSAVTVQDIVANTAYFNMLNAESLNKLCWESPLARISVTHVEGNDLFRLEPLELTWCGMPVRPGTRFRLRHMPTGGYLRVHSEKAVAAAEALKAAKEEGSRGFGVSDELGVPPTPGPGAAAVAPQAPVDSETMTHPDMRLALDRRYSHADAVWVYVSFSKEDGDVSARSYCFMQHEATGFWLSGAGPNIPQPDGIEIERVYPVAHPMQLERNVMMVTKVDEEYEHKVWELRRLLSIMRYLSRELGRPSRTAKTEALQSEEELLALINNGNNGDFAAVEAVARSSLPEVMRTWYGTCKRVLRDTHVKLDPEAWRGRNAASGLSTYQTLCRELGVIDTAVQLMRDTRVCVFAACPPFKGTQLGKHVIEIGQSCHQLLQEVCRGHELNQEHVAKYSPLVMSHLKYPVLKAADTLAAMYEDNMAQMQTVTPEVIRASVNLIRKGGREPRFINFLRQICGTRERPMPSNQNWLAAEILCRPERPATDVFNQACFDAEVQTWRFTVKDREGNVEEEVDCARFHGSPEDCTSQDITSWQLAGDPGQQGHGDGREAFIYYCYSLHFIASLCNGRNSLARRLVQDASHSLGLGLEFESLHRAVQCQRLPFALRTVLLQLMLVLYIDVDPHSPLRLPRHIRFLVAAGTDASSDLDPTKRTASSSTMASMADLLQTILKFLESVQGGTSEPDGSSAVAKAAQDLMAAAENAAAGLTGGAGTGAGKSADAAADAMADGDPGGTTIGQNSFIVQLLRVLREMFRLGMLDLQADVTHNALQTMLNLVRHFDRLPLDDPERFKLCASSRVVMEAKRVTLQILDFALDMQAEQQSAEIFEVFSRWQRSEDRAKVWQKTREQPGAARSGPSTRSKALLPQSPGSATASAAPGAASDPATRVSASGPSPAGAAAEPVVRSVHNPGAVPKAGILKKPALGTSTGSSAATASSAPSLAAAPAAAALPSASSGAASPAAAAPSPAVDELPTPSSPPILQPPPLLRGAAKGSAAPAGPSAPSAGETHTSEGGEGKKPSSRLPPIGNLAPLPKLQLPRTSNGGVSASEPQASEGGQVSGAGNPPAAIKKNAVAPEPASNSTRTKPPPAEVKKSGKSPRGPIAEGIEASIRRASVMRLARKNNIEDTSGDIDDFASRAVSVLERDNEGADFPLFKLDVLDDGSDAWLQEQSPAMYLLDLIRYEDPVITAKSFQLMERLLSKREGLVRSLMDTFVVTDADLITLAAWAARNLEALELAYNGMGALDPAQRDGACQSAIAALGSLTSLVVPYEVISVPAATQGGGQAPQRILVTHAIASNCQFLLNDMQVHHVVLKYLKLPLPQLPAANANTLPEAEEPVKRDVFVACLVFLRHFLVSGALDANSGTAVASSANQAALLPSLPMLTSLMQVAGLPTSDVLAAMFVHNLEGAQKEGREVATNLIKNIVQYGQKQQARWLALLSRVLVVDGQPIKKNQTMVMQLAIQYEEDFLALWNGEGGPAQLAQALATEDVCIASPPSVLRASPLAYHAGCVQLLADCCVGEEPELIVKVSGYFSLQQIVEVLLAPINPSARPATRRYVHRAYWALLHQCYFATDTENTRNQVRNPSNRIWPAKSQLAGLEQFAGGGKLQQSELMARFFQDAPVEKGKDAADGVTSLMEVVLRDLNDALSEPRDAMAKPDSATLYVAVYAFPAITEYMNKCYQSHTAKMPELPTELLSQLRRAVTNYVKELVDLAETDLGTTLRAERKMAMARARSLLKALAPHLPEAEQKQVQKQLMSGKHSKAPSGSQRTAQASALQSAVQADWSMFVAALARGINVHVNEVAHTAVEYTLAADGVARQAAAVVKALLQDEQHRYHQAALLRMARLLAAPYGCRMAHIRPPMCFEEATQCLSQLLASNHRAVMEGWPDALLVRMIRAVRAALLVDTGYGSHDSWKRSWRAMGYVTKGTEVLHLEEEEEEEEESEQVVKWRQLKYNALGATTAAINIVARGKPEAQFEALQLLQALLMPGNKVVQDCVYELLSSGSETAVMAIANFKAIFTACKKYLAKRKYSARRKAAKKKLSAAELAAQSAKKAVTALLGGVLQGAVMGAKGLTQLGDSAVRGAAKTSELAAKAAKAGAAMAAEGGKSAKLTVKKSVKLAAGGPVLDPREAPNTTADTNGDAASENKFGLPGQVPSSPPSLTEPGAVASAPAAPPSAPAPSRFKPRPLGEATEVQSEIVVVAPGQQEPAAAAVESAQAGGGPTGGPAPQGAQDKSSQEGEEEEEEEGEEEVHWEEKKAKLNDAGDAIKFMHLLLNTMKQMCEDHHSYLQLLLWQQPKSSASVDLVAEAVELLNVLQDNVGVALVAGDAEVPNLMVTTCTFLQEMVQGPCLPNQVALTTGTAFLATCNRVFGYVEFATSKKLSRPSIERRKCNIKLALLNLLSSMLESVPSSDIPNRMMDVLDFSAFERQLQRMAVLLGFDPAVPAVYTHDDDDDGDENDDEDDSENKEPLAELLTREMLQYCSLAFKLNSCAPSRPPALPVVVTLYNTKPTEELDMLALAPDMRPIADQFRSVLQQRLGYVEILWNGRTEPQYFMLTPECSQLVDTAVWCSQTIVRLQERVSPESRSVPPVKAAELVDALQDVVDDIELESSLAQQSMLKWVNVVAQYRFLMLQAAFYLAVTCLIILPLCDVEWSPSTPWPNRGENWKIVWLTVMVALQMAVMGFVTLIFLYTDLYKYIRKQNNEFLLQAYDNAAAAVSQAVSSWRLKRSAASGGGGGGGGKGAASGDAPTFGPPVGVDKPPEVLEQGWLRWSLKALSQLSVTFLYWRFWYVALLMCASALAFFVSPFFLVFHFVIYFLDFDSGKTLVEAMMRSGINILNTFVLGVLTIYVFAVITYLAFRDPLNGDNDQGPPCGTFYQCLGSHMLAGIKGDIGSLFAQEVEQSVPEQVDMQGMLQARSLFVLLFFMVWTFILINIFVGLIASAFEAIRDDQNTIRDDSQTRCLVCSLDMYTFDEQVPGGFSEHVARDHNPLQYVFFLHHLRRTDPQDYTGAESAVVRILSSSKTTTEKGTWLPVSRSLALQHSQQGQGQHSSS